MILTICFLGQEYFVEQISQIQSEQGNTVKEQQEAPDDVPEGDEDNDADVDEPVPQVLSDIILVKTIGRLSFWYISLPHSN